MTQTELVILAKTGDQDAINQLVDDHIKYINFLSRRYEYRYREDARQLGVQAFLESIHDFDPTKGYRLITFASFRIRKGMRKALRQDGKEFLFDDTLAMGYNSQGLDGDAPSIENTVASKESSAIEKKLRDALQELSDIEREILKLQYFEGFTCREIGEIVQLSNQRVSQISSRAVKRLKEILKIK